MNDYTNKIIATDLDGTLLYPKDKKNIIYPPNLYFIQSFIDKGGKVIIVSGRSLEYGKKIKKIIDRDISIVSYNGSALFDNNELIFSSLINKKELKELIDDLFINTKILGVGIFCDDGIYIKSRSQFGAKFATKCYTFFQKGLAEKIYYREELYEESFNNKNIYKLLIFFGIGKKSRLRAQETNKIIRNVYENFESSWSNSAIEITNKNINKGEAIEEYVRQYNINIEDIFVVGDSGNDISMFKKFHKNSFCMSHSPITVRKYAKYNIDKFEDLSRYILEK